MRGRTGTCLSGAGYFPAAARIGWGPVMVMIKRMLALLGSGTLAILLLRQAETAAQAARDGVQLCLTSVIPALFPFFAVSSLLVALGAAEAAGRALAHPFGRLFCCGGAGCAALLLGLVGGYPVGARTAAELVSGCGARVYPVGRLDMDSEGLLLMTNDGAWMQRLLHPSHQIEKEYRVTVTGPVEGAAQRLAAIRDLEGERIRPARVRELWRDGSKAALSVTIHEGKNRQIRRMCRQAGLAVRRLQRVREHTLTLGDLPVGQWRYLTQQELRDLEGSEKS